VTPHLPAAKWPGGFQIDRGVKVAERLIYDAYGDVARRVHYEHDSDDLLLETIVKHDASIERNKMLRETMTGKETYRHVASVPLDVAERAMREGWYHDEAAWKRWLNDADNRDHRVWQGTL
jgi:hypothetical protein